MRSAIALVAVAVVAICTWVFLSGAFLDTDSTTIMESVSTSLVEYEDAKSGLLFTRRSSWQCNTKSTTANHPDWLQTVCIDTVKQRANPVVVIDTPYIDSGEFETFKIAKERKIDVNGSPVTVTVYEGRAGYIVVNYKRGTSEAKGSFSLSLPFRLDEGITLEETETFGADVIRSISIRN